MLRIVLAAVPLIAAAGWSAWLLHNSVSIELRVGVLCFIALFVVIVFYIPDRIGSVTLRFVVYSSALLVCGATAWTGPVEAALRLGSVDAAMALKDDPWLLWLIGSVAATLFCAWLILRTLISIPARRGERRRPARSDLHGKARLLAPKYMRRLARRRGILLGQKGRWRRSPLIGWELEGAAVTVAPPRAGKGATIALNYLSPDGRGFEGSTVLVDPRGETFCVVARRRRRMGRRVILLDPMGVVEGHRSAAFGHRLHLPDTRSASYNPLDFIRGDEAHAVRDIDVLLDALLTPPADERSNSRHFHDSARAVIGGYMAWIRFGEIDGRPRTLKTLHELLSLPPAERQELANRIRAAPRLCSGLAHNAVEREAQVGREEGGSNFTTIANQLAFMTYPQMAVHTAASTFDPFDLAAGDVDLVVVVPEE